MISFHIINQTDRFAAMIASSVCCLAASTGVASAGILTFENLPSTSNSTHRGQAITDQDTIDGFQFVVTSTLDGPNSWAYYNVPNPYLNSVNPAYTIGANGTTAMFSGYYENTSTLSSDYIIKRADSSLWKFNQAVLTSVWAMGRVVLLGYRNGAQVSYLLQDISNTQQTMAGSSSYGGSSLNNWIDLLVIRNYTPLGVANDFIMDDMSYTLSVPAPSVLAMIGIAACGSRRRRCRG